MSEVPLYVDLPLHELFTALAPKNMRVHDGMVYRGTALTRKCTPLEPYRTTMPRVLGGS